MILSLATLDYFSGRLMFQKIGKSMCRGEGKPPININHMETVSVLKGLTVHSSLRFYILPLTIVGHDKTKPMELEPVTLHTTEMVMQENKWGH